MTTSTDKLRNIGPKSAAWLRQVGLRTRDDLVAAGTVEAFMRVKRAGFKPTLNLLYAIEGALQDCHWQESGAHTGDVSAAMLADAGCSYVILGHSERRTDHGETDDMVRRKAEAAHAAGLVAIVCIGETQAQRAEDATLAVVERQFRNSLPAAATAANTVVAYEPVWAIGTGKVPTSSEIGAVHDHLRRLAQGSVGDGGRLRLLYGGSVKPANAAEILAIDNVDGALVGGASLKAEDFWAIARSCP